MPNNFYIKENGLDGPHVDNHTMPNDLSEYELRRFVNRYFKQHFKRFKEASYFFQMGKSGLSQYLGSKIRCPSQILRCFGYEKVTIYRKILK